MFKSPVVRFEIVEMTFERPAGLQNVLKYNLQYLDVNKQIAIFA